jgi:hypothetical protein
MIDQPINEDNFLRVAIQHYSNMQCTSFSEFEEDIKRFSYIKKLLLRYKESNNLKERLILNHLIILYNIFGKFVIPLLLHKIDKQYWGVLVTFLIYLNYVPEDMSLVGIGTDIQLDQNVIDILRAI